MESLGTAEGVVARVEDSLSRRGVVDVWGLERRWASEGVVMDRGPVGGLKGLGDSSGRKSIIGSGKDWLGEWEEIAYQVGSGVPHTEEVKFFQPRRRPRRWHVS